MAMEMSATTPTLEPPTQTKRERTSQVEVPREIWALRIAACDLGGGGQLVRAVDSVGDPFLAYQSEADAIEAAVYHDEQYGIDCIPVRLK